MNETTVWAIVAGIVGTLIATGVVIDYLEDSKRLDTIQAVADAGGNPIAVKCAYEQGSSSVCTQYLDAIRAGAAY